MKREGDAWLIDGIWILSAHIIILQLYFFYYEFLKHNNTFFTIMLYESMPPGEKGSLFEQDVADLYRRLGAKVKRNVSLAGNQIDVVITESTDSGIQIKTAVECKAHDRSVGVETINTFAEKVRLLLTEDKIDEAVVVASNGYSRPAREAADQYGIDLLEIGDLQQRVGFHHVKEIRRRGFIPNFHDHPEAFPNRLTGETDFVGREDELTQVRDRLNPKCIITITGPPKSGKQRLVGQVLKDSKSKISSAFPESRGVSLLYIKSRPIGMQYPIIQSLARALDIEKDVRTNAGNRAEVDGPDDFDFFGNAYLSSKENEAQMLLDKIVVELEDLLDDASDGLIAVFAEAERVLELEPARKRLARFLAEDPFHYGAAIICTRPLTSVSVGEASQSLASNGRHKRTFYFPIRLNPLSQEKSISLLSQFDLDREVVKNEVHRMAKEAKNMDPFYPGTICKVGRFSQPAEDPDEDKLHRIWLRSYLDEPVTDYIRRVGGPIILEENRELGPLATLLSMALLPSQAINDEVIRHAKLFAPSWQKLDNEDLLTPTDDGFVLTSLGQFLLRTEIRVRYQEEGPEGAAWKAFVNAFEKLLSTLSSIGGGYSNFRDFAVEVEDAQEWIDEELPNEEHISGLLKEMLSLLAADNVLLPFSRQEAESLVKRQRAIGERERLNTTLTELIHATRYLESTESFLSVFEQSVSQAQVEPSLTGRQVRALDSAAFRRRQRRYYEEFLHQRRNLIDKLVTEVSESSENEANLVKWATSWIMNTTGLAISVGEISSAEKLLLQAKNVKERFTSLVGRMAKLTKLG